MTPQGRAIKQASIDFGNGQTLPFTPCKKGYIPVVDGVRKMACPLHNKAREKRFAKDKHKFRAGEIDLEVTFWSKYNENDDDGDDGDEDSSKGSEDDDDGENVEKATTESSSLLKKPSGKTKKKNTKTVE